ncbi:MAG TPA: SIMPL domain-containing protein, partial [Thermodesulfobacteriota bacterium]|nr:SIMPL domain-containing protein [Thermodesulfobacteriota bacterium]
MARWLHITDVKGDSMRVIEAFILGISIILAAAIFGVLHYESRQEEHVVSVVGTATKRFESDIVKWRINISRLVGLNELKNGYALIQGDSKTVIGELKSSGIGDKEIGIQPTNTIQRYDNYGQPTGYELQQTINVISGNISKIESLALNPGVFFDKGVVTQFY